MYLRERLPRLVLAEVEFETEEEANTFVPPEWFGEDVTFSTKYHNSTLSQRTFSSLNRGISPGAPPPLTGGTKSDPDGTPPSCAPPRRGIACGRRQARSLSPHRIRLFHCADQKVLRRMGKVYKFQHLRLIAAALKADSRGLRPWQSAAKRSLIIP